jgi:hypothetical protein
MTERTLGFRGLQRRTLEDQERAIAAGYESMQDYAIDELAKIVLELAERVEQLEGGSPGEVCTWGGGA